MDTLTETTTGRFDAAQRRQAVDMVRKACGPEIGAVRGLGAVRLTCEMMSHPADTAARAAVLDLPSNGTPESTERAPEAWSGRNHETVAKRSRKGRTTMEVKRRGVAPVSGGVHAVASAHDDAIGDDATLARRLAAAELVTDPIWADGRRAYGSRPMVLGLSALDVQRVTDRHYGERLGVPVLEGTDAMAWPEIVRTPEGVDPHTARVAVHRAGISGRASVAAADDLASHAAVYGAQTRYNVRTARWPERNRLTFGRGKRRTTDPTVTTGPGIVVAIAPPFTTPTLATGIRWALTAPHTDREHIWHGHTLVARQTTRHGAAARNAGRKRTTDRTIGTVAAPTTAAGWRELIDNLNRGERVVAQTETGRVTITRASKFNAADTRDDQPRRWQARTAESLALKLTH